jgi:hypothetical protein
MCNLTANISEGTKPNRELSPDKLETVSAGNCKSGGSTSHSQTEFVHITFEEVVIMNYSI